MTQTQDLMSYRLGEDGYAFAKIDPVTTANDEKKEVSVTFFVDPGNRAYVRHINFHGTTGINDVVMRREMRQLEGGWLSNAALERSKERLQRLPFIEKVEYETNPVTGTPDLVDVDLNVKEGLPGQFGGGIGYSQSQSLILNGNFVHSNFMGRGQRIAAEINAGKYSKVYSVSHTDPYRTIDGISRQLSLTYRNITQYVSASSDFGTKTLTAGADYGYPLSEYEFVHFGVALQDSELLTGSGSAQQARDWVRENGSTESQPVDQNGDGIADFILFGSKFSTIELTGGWAYDTRNRTLFPDRGTRHSVVPHVCAAVRQRAVLRCELRLPAVPPARQTLYRLIQCPVGLRRFPWRYDIDPAVSPVFSPADRIPCAAFGRAAWDRRTISATRTAGICASWGAWSCCFPCRRSGRHRPGSAGSTTSATYSRTTA